MDKRVQDGLPSYRDAVRPWTDRRRNRRTFRLLAAALLIYFTSTAYKIARSTTKLENTLSLEQLQADFETCAALRTTPINPSGARDYNKRWTNGTKPVLIRNATIWTGEPAIGVSAEDSRLEKGFAWISADVLVDRGLIQQIGVGISTDILPEGTEIFEAYGRQLTAGIVDMHSHAGLSSVGNLQDDVNEMSKDITPYVRSIDGVDPLHPEFQWIKSGGVTTSLILPGSGNNIGGEAYVLKFSAGKPSGREELSQQDMFADPDHTWRYMKMACGENPKRVYGKAGEHGPYSRLGEAWAFRHALEQARKYVKSQDDWCNTAESIGVESMASYLPQQLEWESLGAVLRGQVRVNAHCYTIADLEAFVRHTNEFKFRLYAFHHAHQTYLIPDVLKRTWGGTPAAALFADNMYYKVEAYLATEKAGKILYEHGITPTYVSDNPVLNSQHVVFEAAKAYGYGLPYHAALAGVTSAPAELLGLGERVGKIKEGFDADIVVWDSDPLSAGATPVQVWIDGAPQFKDPVVLEKPIAPPTKADPALQHDDEMREVQKNAVFKGITHSYLDDETNTAHLPEDSVAIVRNGKISCVGACKDELVIADELNTSVIKIRNGFITPQFTAFGSSLGLVEIDAARDTHDGRLAHEGITRAVDGLHFQGRQLARAWEHGVTRAISAPSTGSIDAKGISIAFRTNAEHAFDKSPILEEEVALHYILTLRAKDDQTPSISAAIGRLRSKLLSAVKEASENSTPTASKEQYEEKAYLKRVVTGTLPLVLSVHSADTIATIIRLKSAIEEAIFSTTNLGNTKLRIILIGGAESFLLAKELAAADIAVVLAPLLPHAQSWDQRRGLTGAPLSNGTAIDVLISAGVLVGISTEEIWETRDLGLIAGIAYANSEGRLSFKQALDLVGANFDKMLGLEEKDSREAGWAIWEGSPLEIGGRLKGLGDANGVFVWE